MIGQIAVILTLLAVPAYLTALAAMVLLAARRSALRGSRRCPRRGAGALIPHARGELDAVWQRHGRCAEVLAERVERP